MQLTKLDIKLTRPLLLAFQSLKELARPVLRGDDTQRTNDDDQEKGHVESNHQIFSATRITALRARGLAATSAAEGLIILPIRRSLGVGN